MTDLPTGTVTFLFTDIEGSTSLLQELGDRYPAVLDEHAAIIRRAVADGGGVGVSTHGDAFFAVFRRPAGAVGAGLPAPPGPGPERLHQRVVDGLPAEFPAPRTPDARPSNLPPQLTSFVGREEEIAEVERLLGRTRLLTLTGPGGSGKSRLALRVATELLPQYRDGSCFVDLSPVTDPALVPAAVANALGVPESPERPILDGVKDHLRHRELLQVVDNFEQVAEAGPVIEELLTAAPKLRTMVTSRVVLSLRGEQEYAVPPLQVPDPERLPRDLSALTKVAAVRLFADRAQGASPRFGLTEQNAPVRP